MLLNHPFCPFWNSLHDSLIPKSSLNPTSIPSPLPTRLCPLCLLCLPRPAAVWTAPTVVPLAHREARKLIHPVRPVATAAWHIHLQEVPTASAVSPLMTRASSLKMPTSTPNPPHPCPRTSPARYHSLIIKELLLLKLEICEYRWTGIKKCLTVLKIICYTITYKRHLFMQMRICK